MSYSVSLGLILPVASTWLHMADSHFSISNLDPLLLLDAPLLLPPTQPNLLYQRHAHSHATHWVPPPLLFSSQQWNLGAMAPFPGPYCPSLAHCPFFPLKGLLQISYLINSLGQGFITSCLDNDKHFTPPLFVHPFFQSTPVTQLLIMPPPCLWHRTSWALMLLYGHTHFLLLTCEMSPPDLVFHYLLSHPCSFLPPKTLHPSSFYSWAATS